MKTNMIPQRRLACLSISAAALVAACTSLFATELLQNNSFDQGSTNWNTTSAAGSLNLWVTNGQVNLHIPGYYGNVINQELDMPNAGGASGTASITLQKNSPLVTTNTIAVYVVYTDTAGFTNRLLLFMPANADMPFNEATNLFSTFALPTNAVRLIRYDIDKIYNGNYDAFDVSLNVTPALAPKPDPSLQVRNLSDQPPGEPWRDWGNQLALSGQTVHVAWVSLSEYYVPPQPDLRTNRLCYRRSLDGGVTFEATQVLTELVNGFDISGILGTRLSSGGVFLAADGNNVHLVCRRTIYWTGSSWSTEQLWYFRSTDGGATFEPGRYLAGAADNYQRVGDPFIAASQGKVSLAFVFGDSFENYWNLHLLTSPDNGTTWLFQSLASSPQWGSIQTVGVNELRRTGDHVGITFVDNHFYPNDGDVRVGFSTDGGTNVTLTTFAVGSAGGYQTGNYGSEVPRHVIDGDNVYVAYVNEDLSHTPAGPDLFFRRSTNGGLTFSAPLNLTYGRLATDEAPQLGKTAIAARGDNVYVTFYTGLVRVYLARSTNGGQSFLPDFQLLNHGWAIVPTSRDARAQLAIDPSNPNRLHALWGAELYWLSTNAGASWLDPLQVSLPGVLDYRVYDPIRVGVDDSGAFHFDGSGVIYAQRQDYDIRYRRLMLAAPALGATNQALYLMQRSADFRYDNLQLPAGPYLDVSNAVSLEVWARFEVGEFYGAAIFAKLGMASDSPYTDAAALMLRMFAGGWGAGPWDKGFLAQVTTADGHFEAEGPVTQIQDGEWHHLAMTYDADAGADNLRLYVDGALNAVTTATGQILQGQKAALVGPAMAGWGGDCFTGQLDDLRLWNRALTPQEIRDRFGGPLVGNEPGLIAYYPFDGSSKETTGNGMDGVPMYRESYGLGVDTPPVLHLESAGPDQWRLSWVTFSPPYILKSTPDLSVPDWQPVSGTPQFVNGRWTQTVRVSGAAQFFRLSRP